MKVLLANKFFYPKGGDAVVCFSTGELLSKRGHQPVFFSMEHPNNLPSPFSKYFVTNVDLNNNGGFLNQFKTAGRILYSFEAKKKIERLITDEKPDIAHLHNICHQISPSIIDVLKAKGVPVVMTLHDYKLTCPVYILLRDGKVCEECSGGRFYKAFTNRCTKGSALKSAVNMTEMYLHHKLLHIYEKVDEFISPSRFLLEKTIEMGFKGNINYLPNFINPRDFVPSYESAENSIVYVGRLSEEKGVSTLIKSIRGMDEIRLKIIGDGPLMYPLKKEVITRGQRNVIFLGFKSGEELKDEIRKSLFTVIPSEWYENNPRSVLEAFALGKPVVGSRIGGIPELVMDGKTGLLFNASSPEDLREKIKALLIKNDTIKTLGKNAREFVEEGFNPEVHYSGLMRIYEKAMVKNRRE